MTNYSILRTGDRLYIATPGSNVIRLLSPEETTKFMLAWEHMNVLKLSGFDSFYMNRIDRLCGCFVEVA